MQLFWLEMKKIFSWKLIFLVVLVNIIVYQLLLGFDIKYFPNGSPAGDLFKIEQQIIPKYGDEMDEAEFLDLQATYEKEVAKADAYLANDLKAVRLGLDSYEKFVSARETDNEEKNNYVSEITFNSTEDFPWELQAYKEFIDNFENRESDLNTLIQDSSGGQKKRYEQLLEEGKFGIYSDTVIDNFQTYKTSMAIVIFLSIVILISPIFLRDVSAGVVTLQYTSKKGRTVYRTKWLAGLVSSVLLTSVLLILYMTIYSTNETSSYFDLPLHAFNWVFNWYDLTFFQYIVVSVLIIFVLSVLLGVLTMAISTAISNTIELIAVQIVVIFVMIAGVAVVLVQMLMDMQLAQAFVPSVLAVFVVIVLFVMSSVWKRENRKDIV
ncbi:hypothetical protein [Viridibacillus arvi]|uniref:hypothetical protein n=1 Tax=Viridibacillus arvi TaxID=263475 RepID=UPI003D27C6C0